MSAFLKYVELGGYVMPPLILAAMLLWYGIGYRIALLWRGGEDNPRKVIDRFRADPARAAKGPVERAAAVGVRITQQNGPHLERNLEVAFSEIRADLDQYRVLTKAVVAVAPLLGLLGTVSGMIETFASLGDMTLFSQSGGIAGGISQALLTTQFGLSIAIPGLVMRNFLELRQQVIESRLDQTLAIFCGKEA